MEEFDLLKLALISICMLISLVSFEFTVFQRNLKEWHDRPWTSCLRVLKENNKSRFDSENVRNSVLIISHITFRDCRVFRQPFLK